MMDGLRGLVIWKDKVVEFDSSKEKELLHVIKELVVASLGEEFRANAGIEETSILLQLFGTLCNAFGKKTEEMSGDQMSILVQCGKLLRNLCASSEDIQNIFQKEHFNLLRSAVCDLVRKNLEAEETRLMLKTFLQLLGNLCVNNERNQSLLWEICFPQLFIEVFQNVPCDVSDLCCMSLHVCTLRHEGRRMALVMEKPLLSAMLKLSCIDRSVPEWVTILLQSYVENGLLKYILESSIEELSWNERHVVLCMVENMCLVLEEGEKGGKEIKKGGEEGEKGGGETEKGGGEKKREGNGTNASSSTKKLTNESPSDSVKLKENVLQEEDIVVLVKEFRLVVDSFGGRTSEEQLKLLACSNESVKLLIDPLAAELSYMKDILLFLCQLSGCHGYNAVLQMQESAVRAAIDAFKVICRIDGSSKGNLNPSKLKDSQHLEDEVGNPLFGIKGNLVRFLGNLAHRCPANQTLIADLDGLHLILSHFQVDHLNPLQEWDQLFCPSLYSKKHFHLLKSVVCNLVRKNVEAEETQLMLKTFLQLLANVCVNNERNQSLLWEICFPQLFMEVFRNVPCDVSDLCCMSLHVCTLRHEGRRMALVMEKPLLSAMLKLSCKARSLPEWVTILFQLYVGKGLLKNILESSLEDLYWNERHVVLSVVESMCLVLKEGEKGGEEIEEIEKGGEEVEKGGEEGGGGKKREGNGTNASSSTKKLTNESPSDSVKLKENVLQKEDIVALVNEFHLVVDSFGDRSSEEQLKLLACSNESVKLLIDPLAAELSYMKAILLFLCQLSGCHGYNKLLQMQESAVRAAIDAFKVICRIDGSSEENPNPSKLKDCQRLEDEAGNPLFGIKGNLVHFLGNLAHRCPANQTLITELDGLHLILNHFQVDHLNPYIAQWSTWAVRNLCEGHHGNQVLLAQMEKIGTLDVKALEENGFEVELGPDGKIRVKVKI